MTPAAPDALALVREAGILLESARGPVPNLAELLVGKPIKGNWWAHPKGRLIFRMTREVRDHPDVLVCRLIGGKVTFVHKRLWPALARLGRTIPKDRLARIREEHTETGAHRVVTTPFPDWLPAAVRKRADAMDLAKARAAFDSKVLAAITR